MKSRTFVRSRKPAIRRKRRTRLFVLGAAVTAGSIGVGSVASAAEPDGQHGPAEPGEAQAGRTVTFNIPEGQLSEALVEFQRATGIKTVLADPGLGMIVSPGVSGAFTPLEAMRRLLSGTSVGVKVASDGTLTLNVAGVNEFVSVQASEIKPSSPKYTQPLRDTPQTFVVIPQNVFQQQGANSLRDVLRNTPGITMAAGEGGAAPGDNIMIRGFSARNDVYVDGARDPGVANRDTFNTESVEMAKGPSSVTTGRGSTGGSVNLVTKSAAQLNAGSFRVTGGNAGYMRGSVDVNRRVSDLVSLRLNGMWQDAGVPRRDEVTQKGWGIAPSLAIGLDKPTSVTLNYSHLHQNNVPDYGLPGTLPEPANGAGLTVEDLDFANFYGLLSRDYEKTDSDQVTATLAHRFSNTLSLRNLTRYGRNALDRVVTSPRAATAANSATDPDYNASQSQIRRTDTKYQYRDDRTVINQTDLTTMFKTGKVEHDAVVGVEFTHDSQPSYAATDTFTNGRPPVTSLFEPEPRQTYVAAIAPTGATSDGRAVSAAAYAFDTVKLGEKWQVDLGGRFDHMDVNYDTLSATGVAASYGRIDDAFSGRGGLVFKPVQRASVYGAYSSSFNPSFDGNFGLTLGPSGVNSQVLPPERTHNLEVGTKWDVRPDLFATAALFRTEKTNAKTTDTSGATVLAGNQRVSGVEFGLSGNLTSRWGIFTGLALMDSAIDASGVPAEVNKQLSYLPKMTFNVWSTYQMPLNILVGGGIQYTDGYYFTNTNALSTANLAAMQGLTEYWLFSLMGTYRLNSHVSFQINATNLGNERYVERGYTGHFVPGAGRALQVGPVVSF